MTPFSCSCSRTTVGRVIQSLPRPVPPVAQADGTLRYGTAPGPGTGKPEEVHDGPNGRGPRSTGGRLGGSRTSPWCASTNRVQDLVRSTRWPDPWTVLASCTSAEGGRGPTGVVRPDQLWSMRMASNVVSSAETDAAEQAAPLDALLVDAALGPLR